MKFEPEIIKAVFEHAGDTAPLECCGVVIVKKGRMRYIPCRNIARDPKAGFSMHPEDYAGAADQGDIVAIAHSHPYAPPAASQADKTMAEKTGVPWLIVNFPVGQHAVYVPDGYAAPLVGREYSHGVLDCFSIIRDYYAQKLSIDMPDFNREDEWWHRGGNLYLENYEKAGFIAVEDEIRTHDVLLMQIESPVPNHAAIYIGDMLILHHITHRLSSRDVYGGFYQKATVLTLRHTTLL